MISSAQPRAVSPPLVVGNEALPFVGRDEVLAVTTTHSDREPFIGRGPWLARLEHAFRAVPGRGTSVLVYGEPGIGKTRLLQRFADDLRAEGGTLLFGHGCADPGTPALWPFIEVLQGLLRTSSPPRRDVRHLLQAFEPWLPRQPTPRPALAAITQSRQPTTQFMLIDSLIQLVLDAAESGPLCLVLEDVHEFDASSLQLLRRLQRQLDGSSLMVLASCRSGEELGDQGQLLAEALAGFSLRIGLTGLEPAEVHSLMEIGLGRPIAAELASAVHERAEGNPLYVHAVIAMLHARDTLGEQPLAVASLGLPVSVWRAGQRQLDCLSSECRRLLRTAAVFGREFALDSLARCAAVTVDRCTLESLLVEACAQRVLCRSAVLEHGYRFTHALLREVLEHELDSAQRKRAHAEAAQSLLSTAGSGDARTDCRIARHWLECEGDEAFQRAAQLAERAAQAARARGAHAESAAAFGIVVAAQRKRLSLASESPALQKALGRQLVAFAARLWRAGQLAQALAQYAEAAQIAQVIGDQRLLADAVLGSLGDVNGTMSPDQLALCELACRTCSECPIETQICLLARFGSELCFGTRRARGVELIEEAVRLGAGCTQPAVQFALLRAQRAAWDETVPFEQRCAVQERRARLAARHHDVVEAVWSHVHFMNGALEFADAALMRTHYEQFSALAPRAGEPLVWWARVQGCTLALLQGEFDKAIKLAHEARQLGSQVPNVLTVFWTQWAVIRDLQGHADEALTIRQRALEHWDRPELHAALVVQYSELGRGAEARLEFERAVAGNPESVYALCRLAEAAHSLGESRVAATLYERLRPFDARCALSAAGVLCVGAVAYYAGLAAITAGHRPEAVALFQKAIAVNHAMGAMPALAFSHFQLANATARETPGEARGHARTALQLAQALGMTQFATRAESLCSELAQATEPAAQRRGQAASVQQFQRRGEYWQIAYRGQSACVRDLKGMHYLEELLAEPGQPKHVLELIARRGEPGATAAPAASERLRVGHLEGYERALDGACLASYRKRLHELAEEVQEAEEMHDLGQTERLRRELAFLEQQLLAGSKARHRPTERARKAVYNRIRQAIQHIEDSHVELARHLVRTIQTGAQCVYRGESEVPWTTSSNS